MVQDQTPTLYLRHTQSTKKYIHLCILLSATVRRNPSSRRGIYDVRRTATVKSWNLNTAIPASEST